MIMSKPEISSKFDVDDIRKIREYNSLRHIHMTQEEIVADTKARAADLLELWNREPIRHLGIHTGRVKHDDFYRQPTLFDEVDYGKLEKLDKTVDALRKRFGMDSVMRAAFADRHDGKPQIDHLSGGISREKRTVDYSRVTID